ncbi:MAG: lactate utilization protein [Oscillospiraceae bacterium]|nr:lactate utilization protein [Oscillospiraceae bacterium]
MSLLSSDSSSARDLAKVSAAIEANHMRAHYARTPQEAFIIAKSFLTPGCKVAVGGSYTLRQIGIQQLIETGPYDYVNRYVPDTFEIDTTLPASTIEQSFLSAYDADVYFASANALTCSGELMFVDGQGNRVSAVSFGPRKVVLIVGENKIVDNIEAGFERIKTVAAPANNRRYNRSTPCVKLGYCTNCKHEQRGCSDYLILSHQRDKERIHIIVVAQSLGF